MNSRSKLGTVIDYNTAFQNMPDFAIEAFQLLSSKYKEKWNVTSILVDLEGNKVAGEGLRCSESMDNQACRSERKRAVYEALRWGEPSILPCSSNYIIWAVPVMMNSSVYGGIVAEQVRMASSDLDDGALSPSDVRKAAADLLSLAEEINVTNAAFMELKRNAAKLESERAEAIHEFKDQGYRSIRDIYLVEEPVLIAAIKRGDKPSAREILNRVLVGIYYYGRDRQSLLKSFVLELIVTMSRSAVEAGADPSELLGANYSSFTELAKIDTEEELCTWLVSMLERMMDAIKSNHQYPSSVLLGEVLKYMSDHLDEDLSRDEMANMACLSPSHFSRVVKQTFGHSYTDLLARMRVEKARELLTITEKSLIQICLECGFSDQSYFTKVFQKYTGKSPGEYRRSKRNSNK